MRLKRLHWLVLAFSGLTGASLLLFSNHKAEALREGPRELAHVRMVESALPIPMPSGRTQNLPALPVEANAGTGADRTPASEHLSKADEALPDERLSKTDEALPGERQGIAGETLLSEHQGKTDEALPGERLSKAGEMLNERQDETGGILPSDNQNAADEPLLDDDHLYADTDDYAAPIDGAEWETVVVRSGDTMSAIFTRAGLSARTLHQVMNSGEAVRSLRRIFPGDQFQFLIADGELHAMRYKIDESVTLHVDRGDSGFVTDLVTDPLDAQYAHATGTIQSSLFLAGKEAGLSDRLIMELAGIFGWDIDFALDIRSGDRFSVIYEELYRDGEKVRTGAIVAAEFINQGRSVRTVRYTDPNGRSAYYSPDGRSMRKAFLRSPVDFRRISSGFNPNRLHPVLGTKRPHRGVDYAAPPGTPIRAAGDGRIVHHGWKGGYGRTIVIQHGARYSTLYAHMNGYARGLSEGSRVRQGQVIGYVGSSGVATGPHLHYEFLVDGVHRNPVTVKLPDAEPIAGSLLPAFKAATGPKIAKLDIIGRGEYAFHND